MAAVVPESKSSTRFASFLFTRPVWLVGVVAVLAAAAVTEAFTLVARAAGVPMRAAGVWEEEARYLPVGYVARSVVLWSLAGVVLAVLLARRARRPARMFVLLTGGFAVLSLAAPALAVHTALATQLVLGASHLIAATVVISILARRLSAPDMGR